MIEEQLDFQVVTRHSPVSTVAEGDVIFEKDDPADEMYIVKSGRVEIWLGDRLLETVSDGGIFGEMAIIDGGTRSATAIAVTESEIVPLDRKQVVYLIGQLPYFAINIMKIMAGRLRATNAATPSVSAE
jgi:CRP/FNR family transcriptional regulator, cyclic AMP receptor protein